MTSEAQENGHAYWQTDRRIFDEEHLADARSRAGRQHGDHGNFEGTATGFGTIVGTGTFVGGKSGTFSYCGAAYLDNGDTNSGLGTGTYESVGQHRWHTAGILQLSDGSAFISEGESDLASRSWKGKMFEKN